MSGGARPVVYDVTRLVTRGLNAAPNGIDRVDFALARHFLTTGATPLVCTALGPRLATTERALASVEEIESYWREESDVAQDAVYRDVARALAAPAGAPIGAPRLARKPSLDWLLRNGRALHDWALHLGRPPREAPHGAIYVNATQFLLDRPWYVRWLEARPDIRPVVFVHDLLPVDHPEFFRPREALLHPRRNRAICRVAAGVIVASHSVSRRFRSFASEHGRGDIAVCVAPPPLSPVFQTPAHSPDDVAGAPYFIAVGTIEPRKNHMLLLNLWRELAKGGDAPKLVLAGKRGWLNENAVDMLTRCPLLRGAVLEAEGLSTPGLRVLMAGARALLMPSFGEGFGLPVAEALAAGLPVVASDLTVFREIGGDAPDYLDPLDGPGWLRAIRDYAAPDSPRRIATLARMAVHVDPPGDFFATVEGFLAGLP